MKWWVLLLTVLVSSQLVFASTEFTVFSVQPTDVLLGDAILVSATYSNQASDIELREGNNIIQRFTCSSVPCSFSNYELVFEAKGLYNLRVVAITPLPVFSESIFVNVTESSTVPPPVIDNPTTPSIPDIPDLTFGIPHSFVVNVPYRSGSDVDKVRIDFGNFGRKPGHTLFNPS